jgi:hypothetical protein
MQRADSSLHVSTLTDCLHQQLAVSGAASDASLALEQLSIKLAVTHIFSEE